MRDVATVPEESLTRKPLRVLNLGAGVQSSTVLLMACRGELPRPDVALFADTEAEPAAVYRWLDEVLRPAAERAGIPIATVRREVEEPFWRRVSQVPAFVRDVDDNVGMVRRQCTGDWKIEPLKRRTKELLGLAPRARYPDHVAVETWLGISGDEIRRMKHSTDRWHRFWHPLVEHEWEEGRTAPRWRNPPMRREDCQHWLKANGYPEAPRSACVFCPLRSNREWERLQRHDPEGWAQAVRADEALREERNEFTVARGSKLFVHRSATPLRDLDFTRQSSLDLDGFGDECAGVCGV